MVWAVDDRFPLSFYYRIANQIVKQAKVYRDEGNLGDLCQALNRYSRLMSEIIPRHQSFSTDSSKEKLRHKKILQEFAKELEKLKLQVGKKDNEIIKQTANMSKQSDDESHLTSQRWKWKDQDFSSYNEGKVSRCGSIGNKSHRSESSAAKENVKLVSDVMVDKRAGCTPFQASFPVAVIAAKGQDITMYKVRHHFSSPVHSFVEKLPLVGNVSQITVPESKNKNLETSWEAPSASRATHDIHISARLMEEFMELARANTEKNLETCGILGAFLKDRTFYVTTLVIPKQETTSNSCQALNEEEIYAIQEEQSLFPVGWIHTHPSQTCFLSSIDLHTQYSYQVMLPEAIAIVMAPTDSTRNYGIFRLSDPVGITMLRECDERGFHSHPETADGSPIYESCSNVYVNPNLRFEIIDLRSPSHE